MTESKKETPWQVLGVARDASEKEIKKAYRRKALQYHPDKQVTDEDKAAANEIFAKLTASYEKLISDLGQKNGTSTAAAPPEQAPASKKKDDKGNQVVPVSTTSRSLSATATLVAAAPALPSSSARPSSSKQHKGNKRCPINQPSINDPFETFDKFMRQEFGDNYKEREDSGWKEAKGVPGLAARLFGRSKENAHSEFVKLDVDKGQTLSKTELSKYIESHSKLWTSLGQHLNIPVKRCISVATNVAFGLAMGHTKGATLVSYAKHINHQLTEDEFKHFYKNYIQDNKGSHEYFLRTIFAVFDVNGDGVLEMRELDRFLDVFYHIREDAFQGDMKLPDKRNLGKIVRTKLDKNQDGVLDFDEIRELLDVAAGVATE